MPGEPLALSLHVGNGTFAVLIANCPFRGNLRPHGHKKTRNKTKFPESFKRHREGPSVGKRAARLSQCLTAGKCFETSI